MNRYFFFLNTNTVKYIALITTICCKWVVCGLEIIENIQLGLCNRYDQCRDKVNVTIALFNQELCKKWQSGNQFPDLLILSLSAADNKCTNAEKLVAIDFSESESFFATKTDVVLNNDVVDELQLVVT